ncbi:MAG: DinB family protein [Bryobacterales bacterium]|nr:DinB family protein [Bryobacterales bacterium]
MWTISLALLGFSIAAFAQNPMAEGQKFLHDMAKNNVLRSAEKMPEENYAFKPVPEVRSFGQLLGHIADAQYLFCSAVLGKPNPAPGIEKSKTTKADLAQALKEAFAYCDSAYAGLTDAQLGERVKFFGREQAKATVLSFNTAHNNEHYGNIVTYLRMKGIVPPSSERR